MLSITVQHDFAAWRRLARRLVLAGLGPGEVDLVDARADAALFASSDTVDLPDPSDGPALTVPPRFVRDAAVAADCRDPDRWQLLYRLLWRLARDGDRSLLDNLTDPDVLRLARMVKSIRRDVHKMHAFVRFRKVDDSAAKGGSRYIAFHRPDHYIVRRVAGFFRERFGGMDFAIFTPDDSVAWDGQTLRYGAGIDSAAAKELAGEDVLEASWKTYYANIFNPARIKLDAMRAEMPVKHWRTLPETEIIPDLLADAPRRVEQMMAATQSANKPTAEKFVPEQRSLPVLAEAASHCTACELCEPDTVTQVVFGEGPADARVVFVGEQPGDQEDKAGRPFVGPAGQLLDELLEEAGVDRSQIYVTNTVKHFRHEMKGNFRLHQKPLARHINACRPWLEAEMQTVSPDIVVALGSTAAQAIMGRQFRVTKSRGQWMACEFAPQFMATIHPSALLRIPDDAARDDAKTQFVDDMKQLAAAMA